MSAGWPRPPILPPAPPAPAGPKRWYQRPFPIVLLTLLVIISAVSAGVVLVHRSITAHGLVIDSVSGRPVTQASVVADDQAGTTDTAGRFQIPHVHRNAPLYVRAEDYYATSMTTSSTPTTIRLVPIPVRAVATSALTGDPLPGTVHLPGSQRVTASTAGIATVYRVGPGDVVTVTAAGYQPARAQVTPNRTLPVVLRPTWPTVDRQIRAWMLGKQYARIGRWMFDSTPTYQYAPTSLPLRSAEPWAWGTGREVVGQPVLVAAYALRSGAQYDETSDAADNFGTSARPTTIAGQPAWHGYLPDHTFASLWHHGPLIIWVLSPSPQAADAVLADLVTNQPRS